MPTTLKGRGQLLQCMCSYFEMLNQVATYYSSDGTVKILKFGTPQTIAIIVLKLVKFDVTLH